MAADKGVCTDHRLVLGRAIEVARDRAGTDVGFRTDGGIADVGQMAGLRTRAQRGLLDLDEIADARALFDDRLGTQVREWTDAAVARDAARSRYADRTARATNDLRPISCRVVRCDIALPNP